MFNYVADVDTIIEIVTKIENVTITEIVTSTTQTGFGKLLLTSHFVCAHTVIAI